MTTRRVTHSTGMVSNEVKLQNTTFGERTRARSRPPTQTNKTPTTNLNLNFDNRLSSRMHSNDPSITSREANNSVTRLCSVHRSSECPIRHTRLSTLHNVYYFRSCTGCIGPTRSPSARKAPCWVPGIFGIFGVLWRNVAHPWGLSHLR